MAITGIKPETPYYAGRLDNGYDWDVVEELEKAGLYPSKAPSPRSLQGRVSYPASTVKEPDVTEPTCSDVSILIPSALTKAQQ